MRITGGSNRGRKLRVSKKGIRPTKAIVRSAIFNIIGARVIGARVLDIFSGSGVLGLEAISRGALECVFIEKKPSILLKNIEILKVKEKAKVSKADFQAGMRRLRPKKFDLIFMDPPYGKGYPGKVLKLIERYSLLKKDGIVIIEHGPKERFSLPPGFSCWKERSYGSSSITLVIKER
ncbi:16S rRNA (guanine(966)-N(2))-methyltransferase RsmD [candidate division WOR-3 bacterium 4484_100]|uniref:16S rRNA (Guanine(966)-N(2))-methyltransferase RsmD n=1 Tax=candidate division WOR-3 bacterium 4484_100 TaxID=1936077 RepID=A0A1V4QIC4_UNCW3|nr:MAG: 16S rRNA (guanine(966)-N(2))-methyltransferase RsmD [candidate division WOR-3 bacterium 4484_100]